MKIRILGCGTSTGVPVIGCDCEVCTSSHPRNRRTRSSALISVNNKNILIDTSIDLRAQSLANNIKRIDAVLFTHHHADHVHGIDELRAFNLRQEGPIPCYANERTIERIKAFFTYIFVDNEYEGFKPNLATYVVDSPFELFGVDIVPVEISHGKDLILGFRAGPVAYLTDCSGVPPRSLEALKGVELLVIGALMQSPHPSHFTIGQAVDASYAIGARRTVLTHLSHKVDYVKDGGGLPRGVELAYDSMEIEV